MGAGRGRGAQQALYCKNTALLALREGMGKKSSHFMGGIPVSLHAQGAAGSVSSSPSLGKEMGPQQFQHLECDSKEGLGVGLHSQAVLSSLFNNNIVAPCSIAVNIHQKIILVTDH